MHTYTRAETQRLPSPTTHTSTPWGNNSNWRGLGWLRIHTWLPALHFKESRATKKNPKNVLSPIPAPPEANSFSHSAGRPIHDREPTSHQTIATIWAEQKALLITSVADKELIADEGAAAVKQ